MRDRFFRATYGNTFYCGGEKIQINLVIYTFGRPASEGFLEGEFDSLVASSRSECAEHPTRRGFESSAVASSESRGLGFYRLAILIDQNESERFDLRQKGRVK